MARKSKQGNGSGNREEARVQNEGDGVRIDLSGRSLWISTPTHDGRVDSGYTRALVTTTHILQHFGVRCEWGNLDNDSDIVRGRMACLADFMTSGCTDCLFIDSDIRWDPGDVLRLMMHDKEFICGIYMKHNDKKKPVVCFDEHWPNLYEEKLQDDDGNIIARRILIRNAGTGFMMFKRSVVETLMEAHPELHTQLTMFRGSKLSEVEKQREADLQKYYYNLFFPMMQDRGDDLPHHITEDYAFCERWRALGGEIWADPDVNLVHVGNKLYRGRLADLMTDEVEHQVSDPFKGLNAEQIREHFEA